MQVECLRCGLCCQELVSEDFWLKGTDYTNEQKAFLLEERKKYPKSEKGCKFLVFEKNGLASCLIHKRFGYEAKSYNCKIYPKSRHKYCLREKREMK